MAPRRWTHPSVVALAAQGDPEQLIVEKARQLVYDATEAGWSGPPFDPFELAELRGIEVVPSQAVIDANITGRPSGKLRIEFNPDQPLARQRYSVAHELAHALFPDVGDQARFRSSGEPRTQDDWQLELLCNLAAAELLMPVGSLHGVHTGRIGIDDILQVRRTFGVSVEAVALRLVKLSQAPLAILALAPDATASRYRNDYSVASRAWSDIRLPASLDSRVIGECTAVGYTAKGKRDLGTVADAQVEAVGIPPYPGQRFPRVVAVVSPEGGELRPNLGIQNVFGDATQPRGDGPWIVLQVVNDATPNWGGGFARVVRNRWPAVQAAFRDWAATSGALQLGAVHFVEAAPGVTVASMVAMHGYGPATRPRIRYPALESALASVRGEAIKLGASIHAPRIGAGQARGSWPVVAGMLEEQLLSAGLGVTVYDLPSGPSPASYKSDQQEFEFSTARAGAARA